MSQSQIGNLMVALGINTAQFAAGLASAQGSLGAFGDSLKKFAGLAAGALSFGAVTAAVKTSIDHMDELSKTAQKIGIPVEELSKLEFAAKLSDVALEDLSSTLAKFSKNLAELAAGGKNDAGQALKALGLSATDASGKLKPTTEIIAEVADEFAVMRDGAGKTAIAIALFGKSGAEMIPLLNGGRDAIKEAATEAQTFGTVVSEEAAVAAENFNDNLTRLQEATNGVTQQVAIGMLPALVDVTNAMVEFASKGEVVKQISDGMAWLMKEAAKGAIFLSQSFTEVSEMATFLGEAMSKVSQGDFAGVADSWAASQERVKKALEANIAAMERLNQEGQRSTEWLKGDLPSAQRTRPAPVIPALDGGSGKAAKPGTADDIYGKGFTKGLDDAKDAFNRLWDEMDAGIPVQDDVSNGFQDMADTISNSLSYALQGLITGTMTAKEAFASMAQSISQQLAQLASELIKSSILKVLQMMLGVGGGAGFNIGGMTFGGLYADGGTLGSGKWGIAGEAGPELIKGPASITPMDKLAGGQAPQMNVTVINNSSAAVQTRKNSKGDLEVMIEEVMADKLLRGGNKVDAALQRGFGLRRAGR